MPRPALLRPQMHPPMPSPAPPTVRPCSAAPLHRSRLPAAVRQAYALAWYEVDALPHPWRLQVGQASDALLAVYTDRGVRQAAYLTACNPRGRLCSAAENAARMTALRQALTAAGWTWSEGQGRDPQGLWPGEASVLVWGMGALQACAWGRRWAQNAVLHCGRTASPRLLWLR